MEAWFFASKLLNDESFDTFQNIEANNFQYQVMEANLIELTYFFSIDLSTYNKLTSGWFLHQLCFSICPKHGMIILNYICQIFEANKGLEIMTIFTFSTLICLTSLSLSEPKVSYLRKVFGCFSVLITHYFLIVKKLRLIIKILSKNWGFGPFLVYFGAKTSNIW